MKLKLNYEELCSAMNFISTILSDKAVEEKMKVVSFLVENESVFACAYSPLSFVRIELQNAEIEEAEGLQVFQMKAGDFSKILASYSNLSKTKVEDIEFEKENSKIKITVHEEAIEEEDSRLSQVGVFRLENIPIQEKIRTELTKPVPEESSSVTSSELLIYLDSLYTLMSNDSGSMASKLNFANDYVFSISTYLSVFMQNKLPEEFKGLTLGYSSVAFIKKLCESSDMVEVARTEQQLCISVGNMCTFIKYQKVKIKHETYLKRMSTENGIVLDRMYLKDVLKRLMISNTDAYLTVTEDGLLVSNDTFSQEIPINNVKGDVKNVKFKASIPVLVKTIVGNDGVFSDKIFMYFVKTGAGYVLFIRDNTGAWFSTIQVRG